LQVKLGWNTEYYEPMVWAECLITIGTGYSAGAQSKC
jgi:hypothetical protein